MAAVAAGLEGNEAATGAINGFAGLACPPGQAASLFASLRELVRLATRVPVDALRKDFDGDMEALQIPAAQAKEIKKVVFGASRAAIDAQVLLLFFYIFFIFYLFSFPLSHHR